MMRFFQDTFDSQILGCNAYKLFIDDEFLSKEKVENVLRENKMDVLFSFVRFSDTNISYFEDNHYKLISIRSTYKYSNPSQQKTRMVPDGFLLKTGKQKADSIAPSDIIKIAEILGNTSRYFKDKKIPHEKSLQLYATWIQNSIFNGYADESLILMKDNCLAGIHTLKIKNGIGYIDLIGICHEYQNIGLGKVLLQKGIEWLQKQNVKQIEVVTEAENIPATAFYQKNGFVISNIELIYHKHFSTI